MTDTLLQQVQDRKRVTDIEKFNCYNLKLAKYGLFGKKKQNTKIYKFKTFIFYTIWLILNII